MVVAEEEPWASEVIGGWSGCRGHDDRMTEPPPEAVRAEIEALLDERLGTSDADDLTLVQRAADVINGFETWMDLAIRRLHEIHRLTANECEYCSKWLDEAES